MSRLFQKVLAGVLLGVILLISAKSCVVTVWSPPTAPEMYQIEGEDGRAMTVALLPAREALIAYRDPGRGALEIALVKLFGDYGTHYLGPVWNVSGDGALLGFRLYPAGIRPVKMDIEVLKKYRVGPGDPALPPIGRKSKSVFLFAADSLRFQTMWLRRVATDNSLLQTLRAAVSQ